MEIFLIDSASFLVYIFLFFGKVWISSITPPSDRFSLAVADANILPFEDESFDLVTCQTLLMHVSNPKGVLDEMARVLKPGGLLVLSEPTNMVNLSASNTAERLLSLEESVDVARLYLVCQKGKEICGDGFSSIGLHLNYLLPLEGPNLLGDLDGWIRRRMRVIKLEQLKNRHTIIRYLEKHGASTEASKKIAYSGKENWRLFKTIGVHKGMRNVWLENLGLKSLKKIWEELTGNLKETAVYGNVRTVV